MTSEEQNRIIANILGQWAAALEILHALPVILIGLDENNDLRIFTTTDRTNSQFAQLATEAANILLTESPKPTPGSY